MSLVFTMPGKIGDALHQWPVAYWYCQANHARCTLWLDEKTLKPLVPLFEAQPCVEKVELKPGIKSYEMGGQPWNFDLETADHMDHEIYHLGMRRFPTRQITLETLDQIPLHVEKPTSFARTLSLPPAETIDVNLKTLILHGTFASHASGVPGFWRFLADHIDELKERFDQIIFTGTKAERERAREIYPELRDFADGGDFLKLAHRIQNSDMVIGSGSSNVVLAGLLGIPTVRVHDAIGSHPRVIWSNLGENQLNETELDLRRLWAPFRDRWLTLQPAST